MTDCTKVRSKLTYSQELSCIVGSTMSFEDSYVDTYDDIHQIIKNIREKNEIASQVRCILLKVSSIVKLQFICYIVYLFTLLYLDSNYTNSSSYNYFITYKRK